MKPDASKHAPAFAAVFAHDPANARASARSFSRPDFGLRRIELSRELKRRAGRHRFQIKEALNRFGDWPAQVGAADQASQAQTV
jgi:hypothetical protein